MIVSFVFPSSADWTGGVIALYEYANALARRGHEVHFVHGPATPWRVDHLDQLPRFAFEPAVHHHIVDALDDPALPDGDIVFFDAAPDRLGARATFIQGHGLASAEMDRAAFRFTGPKICVASWLFDVAARYGARPEQLWHVPLGMDHELFATRTALDARSIDVTMLYHPHPEKGWDVGVEVLAALRARRADARILVFSLVPAPELPDGVEFVHAPDHRELADGIYNATKVFVQASHKEGFGWTAIEAMACGAALVTTDNGGSRDYARPEETAVVVAPRDVEGLVAGADALLADDARRTALARAGAEHVRVFDWDRSAELLEHHLEDYLRDPGRLQKPPFPDTTERGTT